MQKGLPTPTCHVILLLKKLRTLTGLLFFFNSHAAFPSYSPHALPNHPHFIPTPTYPHSQASEQFTSKRQRGVQAAKAPYEQQGSWQRV